MTTRSSTSRGWCILLLTFFYQDLCIALPKPGFPGAAYSTASLHATIPGAESEHVPFFDGSIRAQAQKAYQGWKSSARARDLRYLTRRCGDGIHGVDRFPDHHFQQKSRDHGLLPPGSFPTIYPPFHFVYRQATCHSAFLQGWLARCIAVVHRTSTPGAHQALLPCCPARRTRILSISGAGSTPGLFCPNHIRPAPRY